MKSRMSIIGRGYLPIGKSPIFNGQKDKYESSAKSVFTGYVFNSENQRLGDGGHVNWNQDKIDAWNKDQGLDDDAVELMVTQSMWPRDKDLDKEWDNYGEVG